jgi:hypothetical protein
MGLSTRSISTDPTNAEMDVMSECFTKSSSDSQDTKAMILKTDRLKGLKRFVFQGCISLPL